MSRYDEDRNESPIQRAKESLERIKNIANFALRQIEDFEKVKSMRWKCSQCGDVTFYTKPTSYEALPDFCVKCRGNLFAPL